MINRQTTRAPRGDRGTVLPEYTLIVALLVVATVAVIHS